MGTYQRGGQGASRRRLWGISCILISCFAFAGWFLILRETPSEMKAAKTRKLDPVVHSEANAILNAPPSDIAGTDPAIENSKANIPDGAPLKPSGTPPPFLDRVARGRMEVGGSGDFVPGPEEVAARTAELQPPEAELLKMTSPDLVNELAASPLQLSIYHSSSNSLDGLLASFRHTHKGVDILLSRPDAASTLLDTYQAYSDSLVAPETPDNEHGNALEFASLEVLLGANAVLDQFESQNLLPTLIESVLLSIEHREQYNAARAEEFYGEAFLDHAATVVGRSLARLDDPGFLDWMAEPERVGLLTERMPTQEEAREILDMAATAYGPDAAGITNSPIREQ